MRHGDFSHLAFYYDKFRPKYSKSVLTQISSLLNKSPSDSTVADIGAGTGIWSRMLCNLKFKKVYSVEPNDEMRKYGMRHDTSGIQWISGSGEQTTLADKSCNLVSMASSFHWVDFDIGIKEFHRILNDDGVFVALWNPRYLKNSPLLLDIENKLASLKGGNIERISSGSSKTIETLTSNLKESRYFDKVTYIEDLHTAKFSIEEY